MERVRKAVRAACGLALAGWLAACAAYDPSAVPSRHQGELDGLERVRPAPWDELHRRPGLDWSRYRRVWLAPVVLADEVDTQRNVYRATDLENVRRRFDRALARAFEGSELLVEAPGPAVVAVRARLTGVVANRPPFDLTENGIAATTRGVGGATVQIDLVDGETGEPLEAIVDRKWGTEFSTNMNRNQTWGDADEAFRWWGRTLRRRFEAAGLGS